MAIFLSETAAGKSSYFMYVCKLPINAKYTFLFVIFATFVWRTDVSIASLRSSIIISKQSQLCNFTFSSSYKTILTIYICWHYCLVLPAASTLNR